MNPFAIGRVKLRTALLVGLCGTLVVGLLPAAVMLERRFSAELEARSREDLLLAPMVLEDRNGARAETLAMHADVVAAAPGLEASLADPEVARSIAAQAAAFPGEEAVLVGPGGEVLSGPPAVASVPSAAETRPPVTFVDDPTGPRVVALARVGASGFSAGVAAPFDEASVASLAALTRSAVIVLGASGRPMATTADSATARAVAAAATAWGNEKEVREVAMADGDRWVVMAPLGDAGRVAFVRAEAEELAAVPAMRRAMAGAALFALLLIGLAGALVAMALASPVRQLAGAAGRLATGDFEAPIPRSAIAEVQQMAEAFEAMRKALAARLAELGVANQELVDRQSRLEALQGELIRQDRLVASGRLVAELAHEIRNPIANVRNCIELVRRRVGDDPEARGYADMAVDELLRMHRLAEQLLDLHRPAESDAQWCDASTVLREVANLGRLSGNGNRLDVDAPETLPVAIPRDELMQLLLNLAENAREASDGAGEIVFRAEPGEIVRLEVLDRGPGFAADVLPHVFDPFFTTKGAVSGVGLGLFVAEGIARRYGGRLMAANRDGGGARLTLELRPVSVDPAEGEA